MWRGLGVLVVEVGHVQCSGYDIPSNPTMVQYLLKFGLVKFWWDVHVCM